MLRPREPEIDMETDVQLVETEDEVDDDLMIPDNQELDAIVVLRCQS